MCEVDFFEGPEKLMEIWWGSERSSNKSGDLRTVPREKWEKILLLVNCQIISEKRNEDMIAYLLSESSMFISKTRVILKTCGTTTLLYAVKPLLQLAEEECGLTDIQDFFYSRMNFLEPELQQAPHQSFNQEAQWLDQLFPNGAAYALGRINGRGCWYLYTLHNDAPGVQEPDQTLEILMQDLDPDTMKKFFKQKDSDVKEVTETSGIKDFLPGALIDDALFDPCGYSMNGLIDVIAFENNNVISQHKYPLKTLLRDSYFTIHITPQEKCSYVSFETNLKLKCYKELINKVLDAFKPGRFLMTLFANEGAPCGPSMDTFNCHFPCYKRNDLQLCQMKSYNLTYGHFGKVG